MTETNEKTAAEIKAEKFAANPDQFYSLDEIVIGIIKTDKGMATTIGPFTKVDFEIALTRLNYKVNKVFEYMEIESMNKEKSPIVTLN